MFVMKRPRWGGIMSEAGLRVCDLDHIQATGRFHNYLGSTGAFLLQNPHCALTSAIGID
jgi:hypothetical protein